MSKTAIQLYDELNSNLAIAKFASFNGAAFNLGEFVKISCPSGRIFFGTIASPNRNLNRDALQPFSAAAINQLEAFHDGLIKRETVIKEVYIYEVCFLGEIVNNDLCSVRRRSQIGSIAIPATEEEVIQYMKLPPRRADYRIGHFMDSPIAICVSPKLLDTHFLIAGATGYGKTNSIGNIISAANLMGCFTLIFDHKPDFQNVHEPNDEGREEYYRGIDKVEYWYIGRPRKDNCAEHPIAVPAYRLDPAMLAATICHEHNENQQKEELENIIIAFADRRRDDAIRLKNPNLEEWTIEDLRQHVRTMQPGSINQQTFGAIRAKIMRRSRVPSWIDPTELHQRGSTIDGLLGERGEIPQVFNLNEIIAPGRTMVIRVNNSDGREYGLLLSYILDQVSEYRHNHTQPRITAIIDEAQDIFCADNTFKNAAKNMLNKHIRLGRSQHNDFIIGVQSASAVPEDILNNLNSRIIFRHNAADTLKTVLTQATEEQRVITYSFASGEAWVQLFGATGLMRAKMLRSPFKLTKPEDEEDAPF